MDELDKDIALEQMEYKSILQIVRSNLCLGTIKCGDELVTSRYQQSLYITILNNAITKTYDL